MWVSIYSSDYVIDYSFRIMWCVKMELIRLIIINSVIKIIFFLWFDKIFYFIFNYWSKWPTSPCCSRANVKVASADVAEAASGTKQPLIAAGFTNHPCGLAGHSQSRLINCGRFKEDLPPTSCAAGGSVIVKQRRPAQVVEGDISVTWRRLRVMADIKARRSDNICKSSRGDERWIQASLTEGMNWRLIQWLRC